MVQPSLYDVSPLLKSSNFLNPLRQHQCEPAPAEGEIHGHRCFISTSSLMKFSSSVTHTGSTSSSYTTAGVHVQTRLRDHMKIHSKKKRIKVAPVVAHVHAAIPEAKRSLRGANKASNADQLHICIKSFELPTFHFQHDGKNTVIIHSRVNRRNKSSTRLCDSKLW